jgi:hypothetical protein
LSKAKRENNDNYLGWGKALGNEEDTGAGGNTEEGSGTSPIRSMVDTGERGGKKELGT